LNFALGFGGCDKEKERVEADGGLLIDADADTAAPDALGRYTPDDGPGHAGGVVVAVLQPLPYRKL